MAPPPLSLPLPSPIRPRIVIHGGAGNITRENVPQRSYEAYKSSLLSVLSSSSFLLAQPNAHAIDIAVHAVSMLEDNPLFNCGKGAVFTRAGTIELESSIMVSNGYRKRGVGCMMLQSVKNPIKLAREMLVRGETANGGGAQGHVQLSGPQLEQLAKEWGMETRGPEYFWTRKRWDQHRKGLEREKEPSLAIGTNLTLDILSQPVFEDDDPGWDGHEYLPQGTVGAVVLDSFGTICVATSTGGLTNKLAGRIGDTPTLGAGFWAEEWLEEVPSPMITPGLHADLTMMPLYQLSMSLLAGFNQLRHCLPIRTLETTFNDSQDSKPNRQRRHAVGMSGTGNGDSFLRTSAVRTAAAISQYCNPRVSLATAVNRIAGVNGELQKSAGDRWEVTGEGEGGIIGIELVDTKSNIVWDLNCGGMFRAWVDDEGVSHFLAFRDERV